VADGLQNCSDGIQVLPLSVVFEALKHEEFNYLAPTTVVVRLSGTADLIIAFASFCLTALIGQ